MKRKLQSIFLMLFALVLMLGTSINVNAEEVNGQLDVTVATDKEEYNTNEPIYYNIKVENNHDEDVQDVKVKAKIPNGLTIMNSELKVENNELIFDVDSIKTNENIELQFTAQVKEENAAAGGDNADKLPTTGARNNSNIFSTILLVVGTFIIIKSKGNKRVISIVLATIITIEFSGSFIMTAKAEENNLKATASKTIKVKENPYTVDVDVNYNLREQEIVEPTNNPPVVEAGEDKEVYLSDTVSLEGTATDDGLINDVLIINWKQINGPSQAIIENGTTLNPQISFIKPGEYEFELSAFDGKYTSKDTIKINVLDNLVGKTYTTKYDFESGNLINIEAEDEFFKISEKKSEGTWSIIYDSEKDDTEWGNISWDSEIFNDGSIEVLVSSSKDGVNFTNPVTVNNGDEFEVENGRYVKADVKLKASSDEKSPIVNEITIASKDFIIEKPINKKPEVSLGLSACVEIGQPLEFIAEIKYNGTKPVSSLTYKWEVLNSNGEVINSGFDIAENPTYKADITFNKSGKFTVRLTVSDGELSGVAETDVVIQDKDTENPDVKVSVDIENPKPGDDIEIKVDANDNGGIKSVEVTADDEKVLLNRDNKYLVKVQDKDSITIKVIVTDIAGNKTEVEKIIKVQDLEKPSVTLNIPKDEINCDEEVVISIDAKDNRKIKEVTLNVDGKKVSLNDKNQYVFKSNVPKIYTLEAIVRDINGNETKVSKTIKVKDSIKPEVTFTLDNNNPTYGDVVTIQVNATDNVKIDSLELKVNGEVVTLDADNKYAHTVATETVTIEATAKDEEGNSASVKKELSIEDRIKPVAQIELDQLVSFVGETLTGKVIASDNIGVKSVEVKINGEKVLLGSENNFIYKILSEDKIKIEAKVTDLAGNSTIEIKEITPKKDLIKPTAEITVPKEIVSQDEEVIINVVANDNIGIKEEIVTVNGKEVTLDKDGNFTFKNDKTGTYTVQVVVRDYSGNETIVSKTIKVKDSINPEVTITLDNNNPTYGDVVTIQVNATDNVKIDSLELKVNGEVVTLDADNKYAHTVATETVTIEATAKDEEGNSASVKKELSIEDRIKPVAQIELDQLVSFVGETLTGKVIASDNIGVKSVEVKINGEKVLLGSENNFTYKILSEDKITIEAKVTDLSGNFTTEIKEITPKKDEINPTVEINTIKDNVAPGEELVINIVANDNIAIKEKIVTVNNEEVTLNEDGSFTFKNDKVGIYTIEVIARDFSGNETKLTKTIEVKSTEKPFVVISSDKETYNLGDEVELNIEVMHLQDFESIVASLNGEEVTLEKVTNTKYKYKFKAENGGANKLLVTVKDLLGNFIFGDKVIKVIVNNTAPIIELNNKEDVVVITKPTDILGTVKDDDLIKYTIEYSLAGKDTYTLICENDKTVENGVLGTIDPTLMQNGLYDVKITAEDAYGWIVTKNATYEVTGEMKIGHMALGFEDINANLAGMPLVMERFYDNRNKEQSDFGVGWSLGLNTIEYFETHPVNSGYTQTQVQSGWLYGYNVEETVTHEVKIVYSDGNSDKFKVKLSPRSQNLAPLYNTSVEFECITNDKVKLEIVGDNQLELFGKLGDTIDEFQPAMNEFKLTLENGTKLYIDKNKGVTEIEDEKGEKIKIDENGYHHSSGKSITFKRDEKGRIIEATDTNGDSLHYEYDDNNDLVKVTDIVGRTISMTYDNNHNIIDMKGPTGISVARNEYDEDGRLIAIIDADGNRIEYENNIGLQQQIIKDKLGNPTVYNYDDNGNILEVIDALGNKITNVYDENNNKISTKDQLGNVTKYEYDGKNELTKLTTPLGVTGTIQYDDKGLVSKILTMDRVVSTFQYDENGNVKKVTDAEGNEVDYNYGSNGTLNSYSDSIGSFINFVYDSNNRPISATDGEGNVYSYSYDDLGNCTSKSVTRKGSEGTETIVEKYQYDKAGNIIETIDAEGNITKVEYDELGNISAAIDQNNRKTTYEYDKVGNLSTILYADGTKESFTYDANGNVKTAKNRNGGVITYDYDKLGNLLQTSYEDGTKESFTYDAKSRLKTKTSFSGGVTTYEYDAMDRNTSIIDANGKATTFEYNDFSNLVKMIDANKNEFKFEYDKNGNRTKSILPDGTSLETVYDARGRITEQKDANGYITKYSYNKVNKLTSVTDALNGKWEYSYNEALELVSVTDAKNNVTKYEYDKLGRVIKVISAAGNEATNLYDAVGNVIESTDYNGNKAEYEYDAANRLSKMTIAGETIEYSYTLGGLLELVKDKNGLTKYYYNNVNQLTKKELPNGVTLEYEYDKAGRLSKTITPYGSTEYNYDLLDRVVRVVGRNGEATVYEYDDLGNRTAIKYSNGITMKYSYDECSRLIKEETKDKDGTILAKYVYTLGKSGERIKIEELDTTTTYEYDKLYRLTKETISEGASTKTYEYTYDAVGNRLTKVEDGITTNYEYNNLNQLVKETAGDVVIKYSYDKNGNLILKENGTEKTNYTFNAQNRLIRTTIQNGADVAIESYEYDYAGNRTKKITKEMDVTEYVVDTSGPLAQVIAELDEDGNLKTYYTRGEELISLERTSDQKFYLYDGHGSVRALADSDGAVTDTYRYDAFGNLLKSTGSTENNYLYVGEQFDANTGFYYLRARYMNPTTGTFISMDSYTGSLFDPVSLHKYLYANANPVMNTDPTGYFSLMDTQAAQAIRGILDQALQSSYRFALRILTNLRTLSNIANAYVTIKNAVNSLLSDNPEQFIYAIISGVLMGLVLNCALAMLSPGAGLVLQGILKVWGVSNSIKEIERATKDGEWDIVLAESIMLLEAIIGQCFTGDTLISTEDGQKRIDEIKEGDYVWSENIETGEKELKKVLTVYVKETDTLLHLKVNGENIDTTENHPFYVEGKGWVAAGDLVIGDKLRSQNGDIKVVEDISVEKLDEPITIYNLEVEDNNNYYVSNNEVLVHNYNSDKEATKPKPYSKNRPSYGKGQVDQVWENAKDPLTGKVYDPTGKEITWDKTKPRNGQWDMGHIPGEKYSEMHELYMDGTITKKEFVYGWYNY